MTSQLAPVSVAKFFDNNGFPLAFGSLTTYAAGTTIPQATYVDSTQTTQNTNPIQLNFRGECNLWLDPTKAYKFLLQDFLGNTVPGWPIDNITIGNANPSFSVIPTSDNLYTLGNASFSWANVYVGPNHAPVLDTVSGNIGYYVRTAAEIAALITPVSFSYPPGHILRYGTNTTPGTTDMTNAINNALASNTRVYVPAGTYFCSGSLNLISGQTLFGDGSTSLLQWSNGALNNVVGTSITGTTVRDLKINITGVAGSFVAALLFLDCTYCKAERLEIVGCSGHGIWFQGSSYCVARANYLHGFQGSVNNSADIFISNDAIANSTNQCQYNVIDGNECFGGNWFGVGLMQYYGNNLVVPLYNTVCNNRVGAHVCYGIMNYNVSTVTDGFNSINGNYIENISGAALSNQTGAGVYVAGAGGVSITANTIRNCLGSASVASQATAAIAIQAASSLTFTAPPGGGATTATMTSVWNSPSTTGLVIFSTGDTRTATFTLASANISWSGGLSGSATVNAQLQFSFTPFSIQNNIIQNPQNFYAILISGSLTGGNISGNVVSMQTGTPAEGIRNNSSSNLVIANNTININTSIATTIGISSFAALPNVANINVSGNNVFGCSYRGINFTNSVAQPHVNVLVTGNMVSGGGAASAPLNLVQVQGGTVTGNTLVANTQLSMVLSNSIQVRISNNFITSTGATAFESVGTCSGSIFDESNLWNGTLLNNGTGCNVRQIASASPAVGTYVLGDVTYNTAGVTPFAWLCTVAGSPGTWTGLTIP